MIGIHGHLKTNIFKNINEEDEMSCTPMESRVCMQHSAGCGGVNLLGVG